MGTETKFGNGYAKNTTTTPSPNPAVATAAGGSALKAPFVVAASGVQPQHSVQRSSYGCNGRDTSLNSHPKQPQPQQTTTRGRATGAPAVPFVAIHIDENNVVEGAKEILKVIRPHWDINAVQFKKFTDGITNKLVGCFNTAEGGSDCPTNGHGHCANGNGELLFDESSESRATANGSARVNGSAADSAAVAARGRGSDDNNDSGNLSGSGEEDGDDSSSSSSSLSATASEAGRHDVVLVRVYGNKTDLLIDRKAETRNILLLHTYGFAPSLYATFKNGLAYDYVPGVTLNTSSVLRPAVWQLVARRMADMHRVVQAREGGSLATGPAPAPMLWHKTQSFFNLVPERFSSADKHKRLEGTFLPIARLRDEFETLYRRLEALDSPLVFAHNDLLLGNVIYTESRNTVTFIDYEYADYNFQAFDIGNHFAEFAGVDEVDYARYPQRDFQLAWLRVYLQAYEQRTDVDDAAVERLYVQVNQFALAAHFFWTIWCLIQAEHSTIDFDYVDYAFVRYNEYLARRDEFLALNATPDPTS